MFKVYRLGIHPKKKKHFFKGEFQTRQKARNFCKKRSYETGLVIVNNEDGSEEKFILLEKK